MAFQYAKKRSNPPLARMGSKGFPDGWNSLPDASALKDTELSELLNGVYSQYGSVSKRQGSQLLGAAQTLSTKVKNAGMFYDIGGNDYMIRVTDLGTVESYDFSAGTWSLLTGTPPAGYVGAHPTFSSNSPVFDPTVFINIVQKGGKIYFASETDVITIFDGIAWKVYVQLADPGTKPTVAKTGSGTGGFDWFYRYADLNETGTTLASPENTGSESDGTGHFSGMPEKLDSSTFLTVTIPAAAVGATKRAIYKGSVHGFETFLGFIDANVNVYIDKGQETPSALFAEPSDNTTEGYHFYHLATYQDTFVGTTVELGKDILVWSVQVIANEVMPTPDDIQVASDSFAFVEGAGFDGFHRGDGESINAILPFSLNNKDGLAIFKNSRLGLLQFSDTGGGSIQTVNIIRGTMSPFSPHVSANDIRFWSAEGVASLGNAANFGTILRYTVMSLKAKSVTDQLTPANLPNVCSAYFQNLSLFGISTGPAGAGNDSIVMFDERYNTWSHWTGLHASVIFKAIHPTTKVEGIYFGTSEKAGIGGCIVQLFQGKTDYSVKGVGGNKITLSITTKQYDAGIPDKFKKFSRAVLIFGSLFGNGTTVQALTMGTNGLANLPRYRISTDPVLSGFGNDEWGTQEIGMMHVDSQGNTLNLRYLNLAQKDLFWTKVNLQNDGIEDEVTLIGIAFYYSQSDRQLPGTSRLRVLA